MAKKGKGKTFSNPKPGEVPSIFKKKTSPPSPGGLDKRDTDKDNPKKISAPRDPSAQ